MFLLAEIEENDFKAKKIGGALLLRNQEYRKKNQGEHNDCK